MAWLLIRHTGGLLSQQYSVGGEFLRREAMELVGRRDAASLANSQLQLQYQSVCERQQSALVRNRALLQDLKQFQRQTARATPKTDRLKILKRQYEEHVAAVYPEWMARMQEHRACPSPKPQDTPTETSTDSSSPSQGMPIAAGHLLALAPTAAQGLPSASHVTVTLAASVGDLPASTSDVSPPPSPVAGHTPKSTRLPGMVSSTSHLAVSVILPGNRNVAPPTSSRHTQLIPPAPATRLPVSILPPVTASTASQQPDPLRVTTEHKALSSTPYRAPVLSPYQRPSRIPVLASRTKPMALPASSKDISVKSGNATQPLSRMQVGTTAAAVGELTRQKTPGTSLALTQPDDLALHDCQTDKERSGEVTDFTTSSSPSSQGLGGEEGSQHAMELENTALQRLEQVVKEPESGDSEPQFPGRTETAKLSVQEVPSSHSTDRDPEQLLADSPQPSDPVQLLADSPQPSDPEQLPADSPQPSDPVQLLADSPQPSDPEQLLADSPQPSDPEQLLADSPQPSDPVQLLADSPQPSDPVQLLEDRPQSTDPAQLLEGKLQPPDPEQLPANRPQSTDPEQLLEDRPQSTDPEQLPANRPQSTDPEQLPADRPQSTDPEQLPADRPQSTDPEQLLADLSASLSSLSDSSQESTPEKAMHPATPITCLAQPLAEVPKNRLPDHTNILPGGRPVLDRRDSEDAVSGHAIETTDLPPLGKGTSDISDTDGAQSPPHANAGNAPEGRNAEPLLHSEPSLTESEPQDKKPQVQEPQPAEDTAGLPLAYSLLARSMQPAGVSPPSPPLLSEGSEIAELERELQTSGRAEGEEQPFSQGELSKSASLFSPVLPKVTAEGSGASQEDSESSLSPFSPAYIPTAVEQRFQASAASKSSALRRKLGFWGDSDSGSDVELQLPAALPPDNEQEDFDSYD